MNKWTRIPKEVDNYEGMIVWTRDNQPATTLFAIKDEEDKKAIVCTLNGSYCLMTKQGVNWDIAPLPSELYFQFLCQGLC